MSQALGDTDLDALAAEYVLGTLGADERTHAQALLVIDDGFAAKVRMWERRFGELHLMVEPVDPDAQIWARIKDKFAGAAQNPPRAGLERTGEATAPAADTIAPAAAVRADASAAAPPVDVVAPALAPADTPTAATGATRTAPTLPSAPTLPAAPTAAPAPAATPTPAAKPAPVTAAAAPFPSAPRAPLVMGDGREGGVRRSRGRWRTIATFMTLIVIAIGGLVAAWRFAPEHVPPILQPVEALRAVGIVLDNTGPPPRPPAPPESQFDE